MDTVKKALVIGAGGFIGTNLVKRLKSEGWIVWGLDLKYPDYENSEADNFVIADARIYDFNLGGNGVNFFDRIYQLAADMGGAGFVFTGNNDADILSNSLRINLNVAQILKNQNYKGKLFYSSSVCCYADGIEGKESEAYPANPPSYYGWEKLTSERIYLSHAKNYGLDTRIARFHNCFGPQAVYDGERAKAPAAICRKVAQATEEIEIWGDGEQVRPFIFIEDLLDGIEALMQSDWKEPVNLGPSDEASVTINQLVDTVSAIAGKTLVKKHIPGPTGGQIRHANNDVAKEKLHWQPTRGIDEGLRITYEWVSQKLR